MAPWGATAPILGTTDIEDTLIQSMYTVIESMIQMIYKPISPYHYQPLIKVGVYHKVQDNLFCIVSYYTIDGFCYSHGKIICSMLIISSLD